MGHVTPDHARKRSRVSSLTTITPRSACSSRFDSGSRSGFQASMPWMMSTGCAVIIRASGSRLT